MTFLGLTSSRSHQGVWVQMDHVVLIQQRGPQETILDCGPGGAQYSVKETPDQILLALGICGAKARRVGQPGEEG